jgi:hypothetical protein
MEMLIIAAVALIAFAAVLVPLFRRGGRGTANEFEGDVDSRIGTTPDRGVVPADATPMDPAGTVSPVTPEPPVARPATSAGAQPAAPPQPGGDGPRTADEVELEVQRYRAALRAGTVCTKCGQANPADSRFCFDCGTQLPLTEAREFD